MKNNTQLYTLSMLMSLALHAAIFACLFLHFVSANLAAPVSSKLVQAVVVTQSQLHFNRPTQLLPPAQTLPEPIRAMEQPAPKQVESPARLKPVTPLVLPKKPEAKSTQEELVILQEPIIKRDKKHADKQARAQARQKEAELAEKLRNEEAQQLATVQEESPVAALATDQLSSETVQAGEMDKYKQRIVQSISQRWLLPEIENKAVACQLLVQVGPGGVVLRVEVLKESGEPNLDRSARNAILKASPLPVPESSDLFDNFRTLRLTFRPEGISLPTTQG